MKTKICFFGLLHVKNNENKNLNFYSINDDQKIIVYLKNAILLDKQLKSYGYSLKLITNQKQFLSKLLKKLNYKINLISIEFKTYVPKNTHFYSCHFRVDIFNYFSKLKNSYSILLDLDILILDNPNKIFYYAKNKISLVNDISKNILPAYGKKNVLKNLNILNPNINKVTWIGGDFFAGSNDFYKLFYKKAQFYQKKFVNNLNKLTNQTDELFISASISDLKKNNLLKIKYANRLYIFNRYWNTNVMHPQKKINHYMKYIFLHLPADKIFLSNCFNDLSNTIDYRIKYFNYVISIKNIIKLKFSKLLPYKLKKVIKAIINKNIIIKRRYT